MKNDSLRSPLARVRGLGSAKSGTEHWVSLRMTALILIPVSLYVIYGFVASVGMGGYSDAIQWLRSPVTATFVLLFLLVSLHHGAGGMREVIEDYVHCRAGKLASLFATAFVATVLAAIGALSLAKIFITQS